MDWARHSPRLSLLVEVAEQLYAQTMHIDARHSAHEPRRLFFFFVGGKGDHGHGSLTSIAQSIVVLHHVHVEWIRRGKIRRCAEIIRRRRRHSTIEQTDHRRRNQQLTPRRILLQTNALEHGAHGEREREMTLTLIRNGRSVGATGTNSGALTATEKMKILEGRRRGTDLGTEE